ncbi:olfactory receptor 14A16-like [Tachyglossus aculeatus]|uniref:olfactory receptor 14A16-like n=1 Tax=Tachyglossus aculeatus TaxID=9261 RepID=UPI0018F4401F|nr:olfactory receptor 14A16-like [Tachyglossus aculeatus]
MSYDHNAAMCLPLCYEIIMDRACGKMAAASWLGGGLSGVIHTSVTFSLLFCDTNAIHQFFCDIPSLIRLSCSRRYIDEIAVMGLSVFLGLGCFVGIVVSYACIFRAVLRIPTAEGRAKAFSTCLPHLIVVILFLSISFFTYLKPPSDSTSTLDLLLSVFCAVVPPSPGMDKTIFQKEMANLTEVSEFFLLGFSEYVHYSLTDGREISLPGSAFQVKMVAALWLFGTMSALAHTITTFSVPIWRSNVLPQFFCDIPQLISLAGPDGNLQEFVTKTVSVGLTFGYFLSIVI